MRCPHCNNLNPEQNVTCAFCGAALQEDYGQDPFEGRILAGRFKVGENVGSGEIGMVYRGVDMQTHMQVAIKLIHADVAELYGNAILKAASEVATLRHVRLAAVQAAAMERDGTVFVVSEWIEGETLQSILAHEGPMPPHRAADILFQICTALSPLHKIRHPHSNLKPTNVFICRDAQGTELVKICDAASPLLIGVRNTNMGAVLVGNAKYFSPEQAMGLNAELSSDQFTMGIIGYQLLSGSLPFFGATPEQLLTAITRGSPAPLSKRVERLRTLPKLAEVIDRCLAKDPQNRYPDLRALASDLAVVIKQGSNELLHDLFSDQKSGMFDFSGKSASTGLDFDDLEDDSTVSVAQGAPQQLYASLAAQLTGGRKPIRQAETPPPPSNLQGMMGQGPASYDPNAFGTPGQSSNASGSFERLDAPEKFDPFSDVVFTSPNVKMPPAPVMGHPVQEEASAAEPPPAVYRSSLNLNRLDVRDPTVDAQRPIMMMTSADLAAKYPGKPQTTQKSPKWLPFALGGAVVLLLGGLLVWLLTRKEPPPPSPPVVVALGDVDAALAKPADVPADADAVDAEAADAEAADAEAAAVLHFTLTSKPEGAKLFLENEDTGFVTPKALTIDPKALVHYTLKLEGHQDLSIEVNGAALTEGHQFVLDLQPVSVADGANKGDTTQTGTQTPKRPKRPRKPPKKPKESDLENPYD